jgi:crossover junction endodeoxyribonuclease RuvC
LNVDFGGFQSRAPPSRGGCSFCWMRKKDGIIRRPISGLGAGWKLPRTNGGGPGWTAGHGATVTGSATIRILGIDPGSQRTGFGIVECRQGTVHYVASGAIRTSGTEFPPRLRQIFEGVLELVREYAPSEVAIERVFMHRNADSALKLGQARGAAICAVFATSPEVFEYAPREVKLAIVGQGGAQKEQVQLMVRTLLKLQGELGPDAADAIGIALCHAYSRSTRQAIAASTAMLGKKL